LNLKLDIPNQLRLLHGWGDLWTEESKTSRINNNY
jgi:hypothetical protein